MNAVSFFVKVEGESLSRHRCPAGIYTIEVVKEKTLKQSASAAILAAKDYIPFLSDNPTHSVKVYESDGYEVCVPKLMSTKHEAHACYKGRSKDYPQSIM